MIVAILLIVFLILIAIAHIAALFTSLYCFKHGVDSASILGLLIMFFLGPFFWFYYAFAKNYCTTVYNVNPPAQN
jgi:glucan phosphoethanolaminetransferase (alkaline phosphatase superfamily)